MSVGQQRLTLAHMAVSYYSLQVVSSQSIVTLKSLAEGILLKGTTSKNMHGMESCQRNKKDIRSMRAILRRKTLVLLLKMELPETPIPRVTVATCRTAPLKAARKLLNIYSM